MGSKGAQHRLFPHSAHSGIDSPRHTLPLDKNTSPPQPVLPERILQETFSTTDIETCHLYAWRRSLLRSLRMTPVIATLSTHGSGHCSLSHRTCVFKSRAFHTNFSKHLSRLTATHRIASQPRGYSTTTASQPTYAPTGTHTSSYILHHYSWPILLKGCVIDIWRCLLHQLLSTTTATTAGGVHALFSTKNLLGSWRTTESLLVTALTLLIIVSQSLVATLQR